MRRKTWLLGVTAIVSLFFVFWPWLGGSLYLVNLITGAVIWGILAVSYDLVLGWTGEISFGHALWFGVGIYGVALLIEATHLDTLLAIAIVAVLTFPLAFVVHVISLRLRGAYFAMITFAVAEFAYLLVQNATSLTGGTNGLTGIMLSPYLLSPNVLYALPAAVLAAAVFGLRALSRSRTGRIIHAVRDNPTRAALFGHNEVLVKGLTLSLSSAIGAIAGGLYLAYQGMAFPDAMSSNTSFTVLLMVVIGGADSIWGSAVAGIGLYLLENSLTTTTSHWSLWLGVVYVLVVRFLPIGLGGLQLRRLWPWSGQAAILHAGTGRAPGQNEEGGS
jgi:branched-chain amino acid transport system permease protein